MLNELQQRVMGGLALAMELSPRVGVDLSSVNPPTFDAYEEFIQGHDRYNNQDFARAVGHFERASTLDPGYFDPRNLAADSYMNLGEFAKAESLANLLSE